MRFAELYFGQTKGGNCNKVALLKRWLLSGFHCKFKFEETRVMATLADILVVLKS